MYITDQYGRSFKTLRISLTNVCNLSCIYCTSSSHSSSIEKQPILPNVELLAIVNQLVQKLGINTIRITGGEPTLYPHLVDLIKRIKQLGIDDIKMTTNGHRLLPLIKPLSEAGLSEINVSLDATTEEGFNKISNTKNLAAVINSIEEALRNKIKIKLNSVIMRGENNEEIISLLDFALERNIIIRFLELMRMGPLFQSRKFEQYFFSQEEILTTISKKYQPVPMGRQNNATAQYWKINDRIAFGIIANESEPFCSDCDRLRLDSYGRIYGCLSSNSPISIRNNFQDQSLLYDNLKEALQQKQPLKFKGSELSMLHIGG